MSTSAGAASFKGKRITLVSQFYWPEHVGIAPYSTRLAEHLAEQGATVNVFTAMPHYPEWRIDPEYRGKLRSTEQRRGVTVHRMLHYIPSRQSAARRAAYEATLFVHAMLRAAPPSDAVIGVIPSLSCGATAREFARRTGTRYGIIVQDLSSQAARQSGISGGGAAARATAAVEGWALAKATKVAVVSPRFQPHVEAFGVPPERITVLRNWVEVDGPAGESRPVEAVADVRRDVGWGDDELVVLHAGNMGLKQGLEFVVDAARTAGTNGRRLRFVLMGDGSQRPMIEERAAGVANLQLLPNMPRDRCNQLMAAADVLLVNERGSIVDMALPSKLTSYFSAGRPVVAAVADDGTTAEEVRRAGGGLVVPPEDPGALLTAIDRIGDDPELAAQLAEHGRAYARDELSAEAILRKAEAFVAVLLP